MTIGFLKIGASAALLLAGLMAANATAQTTDIPGVSIELSTAEEVGDACRLSFVVTNGNAQDITSSVYETVLFNVGGQVAKLTLLDFQDLPAGRVRVRQFQFADLACKNISRVLINGADTCQGENLPQDACVKGINLRSLTNMELIG